MKELKILDKLKEKAVFSVQDIQRIGDFSREYSKLVLNRLTKRELIKRVTRNSYTINKNILVIASNLKTPSYISFWSASSYYGFTEQILNTVYVASTRNVKTLNFDGHKIKFVKVRDIFGYKKIKTEDGELFVADQEKLLIDCLLYFREMGNFDEIEKVFLKSTTSKGKIIEYLKKIDNLSLIKRVGFMIEKYKGIDISDSFKMDRNYVRLDRFSKSYSKLNSKWMVKI